MRKNYQLLSYLLLISPLCMGQYKQQRSVIQPLQTGNSNIRYWAENMQLINDSKKERLQLSVSGGVILPGGATKNVLHSVPTAAYGLNFYLPLGLDGTNKKEQPVLGVLIGFNYGLGNGSLSTKNHTTTGITSQRYNPRFVINKSDTSRHVMLSIEAGPQLNIPLGRLQLSPILSGGLLQFTQAAMQVQQSGIIELPASGADSTIMLNLYALDGIKKTGIAFLPRLRTSYFIRWLGFWAEGQYILGPAITTTTTPVAIQGLPNSESGYMKGEPEDKTIKYRGWGIRMGLSIRLPRPGTIPRKPCTCW
jgi:hypothetical protein